MSDDDEIDGCAAAVGKFITALFDAGLFTCIAVVLSWTKWHSILWAMIHGWFGLFYVIYYAMYYNG